MRTRNFLQLIFLAIAAPLAAMFLSSCSDAEGTVADAEHQYDVAMTGVT